jgi:hypothetical protein
MQPGLRELVTGLAALLIDVVHQLYAGPKVLGGYEQLQ